MKYRQCRKFDQCDKSTQSDGDNGLVTTDIWCKLRKRNLRQSTRGIYEKVVGTEKALLASS